ncbi:MAG TPA: exosortase/archaeosortase family protein [Verrucomicrobiae bacterium]|nr:exosortase/archaeosortase family protein [Verrucomicrobiae bacterium]
MSNPPQSAIQYGRNNVQPENQTTANTTGVLDEFQTELASSWRSLPNKGLFFTLLLAWLALFQFRGNSILGYVHTSSLFSWMYEAYNSPNVEAANDRIGNLIPFLVLGIFWWRRRELLALPAKIWPPAFVIVIGAMLLHVTGYVIQEPHLSIVALFVGIYGLVGLAWGPRWLQATFFPFFLFVFCVPLGNHSDFITTRLRMLVSWLVEVVAHNVLGIGVIRSGTQLFDPSGAYQYEVAAACSGIRSLVAIFLLATVYGFLTFRSNWKRVFMMATAFPLSVLGNLVRMLCIILAAAMGGQSWGNYVHEGGPLGIFSLLPYIPAILGVIYIGRLLESPTVPENPKNPGIPENSEISNLEARAE